MSAAEVVARFYEAQGRFYAGGGDGELRDLLADDVVWIVPGRSAIAGTHRGCEAVLAYFARRREMTDASFRVEPGRTLADEDLVVHFASGTAEREGRTHRWDTLGIFRTVGDRIAECRLLPFDQAAFDEIWS